MLKKTILPLISAFVFAGCTHAPMRGNVAMKVSDDEAHVCLGNKEVKPGDSVGFFRNKCTRGGPKLGLEIPCEKVRIGTGQILRTLNEHYSVVKVASGTVFEEGTIVEKAQ